MQRLLQLVWGFYQINKMDISAITGWSGNINAIGLIGGTVGISQSGISGEFDIGGAAGISGMVGYTWYVGNVYDDE